MSTPLVSVFDAQNRATVLPPPVALDIMGTLDSPAVNFSADIPCDTPPSPIRRVSLSDSSSVLFDGTCDRQRFSLSPNGSLLRIEARDKGALLLDNEAKPRTIWSANLATMFARTIGQYPFSLYNFMPSRTVGMFTVYKGMSEWDAFCGFARRMHGVTPYARDGCVMVTQQASGSPLTLSNTGSGIPYTAWERSLSPYSVLSRVYIRDEDGEYTSHIGNYEYPGTAVSRRRYIIPGTEYADHPGLDARQRIRASMYAYEEVQVICPEIVRVQVGQPVYITDAPENTTHLMVHSWRHIIDQSGIRTQLVLRSSTYY